MANNFDPKLIFHNENKGTTVEFTVREEDLLLLGDNNNISLNLNYEEVDIDKKGYIKYVDKDTILNRIDNIDMSSQIERPVILVPEYHGVSWYGNLEASPFKVFQGNFTHTKTTWYVNSGNITKSVEVSSGDLTKGFLNDSDFTNKEVNIYVDYHILNNDDQTESTLRSLPKFVVCKIPDVRVTGNITYNLYTYKNNQQLEVFNPNIFTSSIGNQMRHTGTQFVLRKGNQVLEDSGKITADPSTSWNPIYKPNTEEYDTKNPLFTPRPESKVSKTFTQTIEKDVEYFLDVTVYGEIITSPGNEFSSPIETFTYLIDTTGLVPVLNLDMGYDNQTNTIPTLAKYHNFKVRLDLPNTRNTRFRHLSTLCEIAADPGFQTILYNLQSIEVGSNGDRSDLYQVYQQNKDVNATLNDLPGSKLQEYVYLSDALLDTLPADCYVRFKASYTFDSKEYDLYFKDKEVNGRDSTLDINTFKQSITVKETSYTNTFRYKTNITRAPKPEIVFLQNIQETTDIESDNLVGRNMVYECNLKLKNWERFPLGYVQQFPVDDVEVIILFPYETDDLSVFNKTKDIYDTTTEHIFQKQFINSGAPISIENTSDLYGCKGIKLNHTYIENRQNYEIDFDPITIKAHKFFHFVYGYIMVSTTRNGVKSFVSARPFKLINNLAKNNTIPVLDGPMDNGKYINQFYIDNLGFNRGSGNTQTLDIRFNIPDNGGIGGRVKGNSNNPITDTTWIEDKVALTVIPGTGDREFYVEFLEVGEGSITFHQKGYSSKKFTFNIKPSLKKFNIIDVFKLYAQVTHLPVIYKFANIDARTVDVEVVYDSSNQLQINKTKDMIEIKSDVVGTNAGYKFKAPGYETTDQILTNWYDVLSAPQSWPSRDWQMSIHDTLLGQRDFNVNLTRKDLIDLRWSQDSVTITITPWLNSVMNPNDSSISYEPLDGNNNTSPDWVFKDFENLRKTGTDTINVKEPMHGYLVIRQAGYKEVKLELKVIDPTGTASAPVAPDPIVETNIPLMVSFYKNKDFLKKFSPIVRNNIYTIPRHQSTLTMPNDESLCTNIDYNVKWTVVVKNKLNQQETVLTEGLGIGPFKRIFGSQYTDYIKCTDMDYYNIHNLKSQEYLTNHSVYTREPMDGNGNRHVLTQTVIDQVGNWIESYKQSDNKFRELLDLDKLKDPTITPQDKQEILKDHDKLLSSIKGLKFRDYKLQKYLKQPNLYSVVVRMELLSITNDVIFKSEIPFHPGLQSKYGNHNRVDLWSNTIYKLPYITTDFTYSDIDVSGVIPGGKLVYPINPLLSNMEPIGHSKSLLKQCESLPDTNLYQPRVLSPYVFANKPTDTGLNAVVFDNLDHLVDMIYSLSVGVEEGNTQIHSFLNTYDITFGSNTEKYTDPSVYRRIAVRRNIVIHCNGAGFTGVEDNSESSLKYLHTPLNINKQPGTVTLEEKPSAYLEQNVSEQTPALDKGEIKAFLVSKNFTPEYFKANKGNCSRRIVIEVYDIAHNRYTNLLLFTEAAIVVFREELGEKYFTGHDGYLNDYIDITPLSKTTTSVAEYPRLLNVNPKTEKAYNVLDPVDNPPRNLPSYLWKLPYEDQCSIVSNNARDFYLGDFSGDSVTESVQSTDNSYSFMLASRMKVLKSNFDFMGMIPFRACTEHSLLGFKGEFVPREEGYSIGQEVVHPITKDLYLCIKDRPGIANKDKFNMTDYEKVEHTYPVGTPSYTVLEDTDYFVKVRSHDNQSGLSEEEYRKYYKSSLPTYVSLLSYLNLLIGSHEGLICPPIHQDLVRGYKNLLKQGAKNPYSLFSYNRIYQKLNDQCIGNTSGLVKEGIKQPHVDPMTVIPDQKHHEGALEGISVEYTNFPYHWLDAYFSETQLDSNNPTWGITPKDQLTPEMEIQNSIKDVLFGGWLKFRNKNYHNIIYVSSRPVLWTRDPELIAGSNILHPRQHIIRVGTKHYYVRILTDNFYPDDDCCQDEMVYNNINTGDPDFVTFNDPNRLNFRESLLTPTMLFQCEMSSGDTVLMSRTGKVDFTQVEYQYPKNSPIFRIDIPDLDYIPGKGAPLPNVKQTGRGDDYLLDLDKKNLKLYHIGPYLKLNYLMTDLAKPCDHTFEYREPTEYTLPRRDESHRKGNLLYNAENTNYYKYLKDPQGKPPLKNEAYNLNGYQGEVTYNLTRQNYDLGPCVSPDGEFGNNISNVSFVFSNGLISRPNTNDELYFGNNKDIILYLTDSYNLSFYTFKLESRTIAGEFIEDDVENVKTTMTFKHSLNNANYPNMQFNVPMTGNIQNGGKDVNGVRPPEMGTYVPIHIVLEAIEEKDLPIYNIKDSLKDFLKEPNKERYSTAINKMLTTTDHDTTLKRVWFHDNDVPAEGRNMDKIKENLGNMVIHPGQDREYSENITVPSYDTATNTPIIPKILNGGYWIDCTRDIKYTLTTNKLKDLVNYKPLVSSTFDTHFNTDISAMFGGNAFKLSNGNFNTEEMLQGLWGGYSMEDTTTNNRTTKAYVYDRWNGCGYLGQLDSTTVGDYNNYIVEQLESILKSRYETISDEELLETHNKTLPLIHVFYFKGKIVLIPTHTPFSIYDSEYYGTEYLPQHDHLEVGRTRPITRFDAIVDRVKLGTNSFDVMLPYFSNDRSLHSNQELVRKVLPTYQYRKD